MIAWGEPGSRNKCRPGKDLYDARHLASPHGALTPFTILARANDGYFDHLRSLP